MKIHSIASIEGFQEFCERARDENDKHWANLAAATPTSEIEFTVRGFSYTALEEVDFICDFQFSGGYPNVNWRERVICPITQLNNRMRAAIHIFDIVSNTYSSDNIYIMEQLTPVYEFLSKKYKNLIGSEYLGSALPRGTKNDRGIRNEDATALSFADQSFAALLSFDVFEHIYDYKAAFRECFRVLKPGGRFIFTVPFNAGSKKNIERAAILENGEISHLLPPEYHGDPLSDKGVLCFRHFGWDMLEDLKDCGFFEPEALVFHSDAFGYFTNQIIFCARKAE